MALTPIEIPIKKLMVKFTKLVVLPTAAKDSSPANRPTTTISAALKSSCKIPVKIKGMLKIRILLHKDPSHMSISRFFCMDDPPFCASTVLPAHFLHPLLPPETVLPVRPLPQKKCNGRDKEPEPLLPAALPQSVLTPHLPVADGNHQKYR